MVEPRLPRPAKEIRKTDDERKARVPPGQFLTEKFPVLTYGSTPKIDLRTWRFRLFGLVDEERELTWQQMMALTKVMLTADFHCVTQWSRFDNAWEGIAAKDLVAMMHPKPEATHVMVHCYGGYTTNLPIEVLREEESIFTYKHDGKDLPPDHGGPMRLIIPKLYGWKSAKWVNGMEFMKGDKPGFWELRGYHMHGDPWEEERFWEELM
ncbi:MAG: sulfite oxidase-like oxidoreductase [Dehalococcoidia bacterium]|nr:sulfite oxidase-like oxidoreductase [Dehalococcoidia bacterium]